MDRSSRGGRERRRYERKALSGPVRVQRLKPVLPISDAEVIDVSSGGIAIRTAVPIRVGEQLSFQVNPSQEPMIATVLATDRFEDGTYRVRCQCLLKQFDAA